MVEILVNESGFVCEVKPVWVSVDYAVAKVECPDDEYQKIVDNEDPSKIPIWGDGEIRFGTRPYNKENSWIERRDELYSLLGQTDYVITKLSEAQLLHPEDVESLRQKYATELTNRAQWRAEINQIQRDHGLE